MALKDLGRRPILRLIAAFAMIISGGPALPVGAAGAQEEGVAARQMIHQVGLEVMDALGNSRLSREEQQSRLAELLSRAIDFDVVGRLILAKHWRQISAEERADYLALFKPYAIDNLASKMRAANADVALERFEVIKEEPAGKADIVVSTDLFWPGYPPYRLDWRLRQGEDGMLRAIDVLVESVSMVVSQRAEFATVIERRGFDALLDRMRRQAES
jgi:phospholipid transport system substrate-binding protein